MGVFVAKNLVFGVSGGQNASKIVQVSTEFVQSQIVGSGLNSVSKLGDVGQQVGFKLVGDLQLGDVLELFLSEARLSDHGTDSGVRVEQVDGGVSLWIQNVIVVEFVVLGSGLSHIEVFDG